jgi:hypothetical protein
MKTIITVFIITLLILLGNENLKAQKTYGPSVLEVKGYVYEGDEKMDGALVQLYQNEKVVKKILTKGNAKFEFILFKGLRYKIDIAKDGFVKEFIIIATKNSPDFSNKKYIFEFAVDLKKVEQFEGLGFTAFDYPSAKINYSVEDNEYVYDRFYDKMIKIRIAKLKLMSESKIKKED